MKPLIMKTLLLRYINKLFWGMQYIDEEISPLQLTSSPNKSTKHYNGVEFRLLYKLNDNSHKENTTDQNVLEEHTCGKECIDKYHKVIHNLFVLLTLMLLFSFNIMC